jgi:preprotein translocase subunit YajC
LTQFAPLIAVFAIFYFVMIGPERKNRKRREEMLKQLKKGDKVMTSSGMFATVAAIDGDRVTLQIDEGVRARFSRASIQEVLPEEGSSASAKR